MSAQQTDPTHGTSKLDANMQAIKSMEEVLSEVMGMGYDPLAKRNATGLDYVSNQHQDTYDFISPLQFDLKGRAVCVTGASRGFGRAIALSYAKAGASYIAIGARTQLDGVKKEIREAAKNAGRATPKILPLKLDVTDKESVAQAANDIEKAFGRCDILINNAGFMEPTVKMTEVNPEDWMRTIRVNVFGTFLMTRAFIPLLLKEQRSLKTVLNVTSLWSLTIYPCGSAYQISKFALARFSEFCNAEYGGQGLMSFHVHPGGLVTELASGLQPEIKQFLLDTPDLGADTIVWATAERREWLAGRYISAQWDMKELVEKKEKIVKEVHLKMRMSVGLD